MKSYTHGTATRRFKPVTVAGLQPGAAAPFCLDDQWLDQDGLANQLQPKTDYMLKKAKVEFSKSLIFAPQIVLNRAYLLNSPLLTGYLSAANASPDRQALMNLFGEGAVAIYVWNNIDPLMGADKALEKDEVGEKAWLNACAEVEPTCVRFDWDNDDKSDSLLRDDKLAHRFQRRLKKVCESDAKALAIILESSTDDARADGFSKQLQVLSEMLKSEALTRANLYDRFIWAEKPISTDEGIAQKILDYQKPFSRELKQLFDLIYNTNLSDALEITPITPSGSLDRSVLSESVDTGSYLPVAGEQAAKLIHSLYHQSQEADRSTFPFDRMALEHIVELRKNPAWGAYQGAKLNLSEVAGYSAKNFDAEVIDRFVKANEAYSSLCKAANKEFGKYAVTSDNMAANAARLGWSYGGFALGSYIGNMLGGIGGGVAGGFLASLLQEKLESRARQSIEGKVSLGVGAAAHALQLPRIAFEDNQAEAAKFLAELHSLGFGSSQGSLFQATAKMETNFGYEQTNDAPDYG